MATEWGFKCTNDQCGNNAGWWDGTTMFEMLKNRAEELDYPTCDKCGHHSDIRLGFEFGLEGKLLDCFYPSANFQHALEWRGRYNQKWKYYPFLVLIDPDDKETWGLTYSWLPYWHVVGRAEEKKYGQWAPCLSSDILADLLRQAREKSYKL